MDPDDLAALKKFQAEVDAMDDADLIDSWTTLQNNSLTELEMQKELYLEAILAGRFGIMKWRNVVEALTKAKRNADRT
ncbi:MULTISPECIES: hypothetical protein [unclassified Mesorhizobium]|uniref:hypothetical protein n=1 Tax=unclassified Mesorhizobium TaxID=325217 RepID=UPI000FE4F862|nr:MULTISPECIES: hypothetical protein [unclassified Mesorhizobium]RWE19647.1 MAG: hypothetical protein EOS41_30080 [Mesorhizobium sp.]